MKYDLIFYFFDSNGESRPSYIYGFESIESAEEYAHEHIEWYTGNLDYDREARICESKDADEEYFGRGTATNLKTIKFERDEYPYPKFNARRRAKLLANK